jgi:hypothetical protein
MRIVKGFALSIFTLTAFIVNAQTPDSLILFSGYILDKDSLPIENALLVNFRTIRGNSTNGKGFFKIWLQEGDSLMINHISYERRIIKANDNPSGENRYYLKFSPYEMRAIAVNYRNIEMENFYRNMKLIKEQMRRELPYYRNNSDQNVYAPSPKPQFASFNFSELYRYLKTEKYKKKYME